MTGKMVIPDRYWSQPAEEMLATLGSISEGLGSAEASLHLTQVGPNLLEAKEKATVLRLFLRHFKSPIILILLFATGVLAVLKDWVDAPIILVIVLGSALLSLLQEYSASTAAEKLRARVTVKATVLREGHLWGQKDVTISVSEIERIEEDIVYLTLDKQSIEQLHGIPVRRWHEGLLGE